MKKIIVALGLVLSLISVSALQAQIKVYNANLVKFGDVNTNPTISSGLEVVMSNFLFKGHSAKFTLNNRTLEIVGGLDFSSEMSSTGNTSNGIIGGGGVPIIQSNRMSIIGPNNDWQIGNSSSLLYSIHAKTVHYNTLSQISDRRYKIDIENLTPASDKIMRLHPVKFNYREGKDGDCSTDPKQQNRVGLIAQELQEVVPEAVNYMEEDDIYTVDYTVLIPFLIKTAQEQQALIENQQDLIENQQLQIEELQMVLISDNATPSTPDATFNSLRPKDAPAETVEATANRLYSNVPNPFKQETRIRYALTDDVRAAQLCIYDLSGKQLSCHRLMDRGESEFTLRAASLMPGIYLYSLIADGHVVDTHRMVMTE